MSNPIDLISLPYQFKLTDGRWLNGVLIAIDDQGNLLVSDAVETSGKVTRNIGLVSVPKSAIVKVYTDQHSWNMLKRPVQVK